MERRNLRLVTIVTKKYCETSILQPLITNESLHLADTLGIGPRISDEILAPLEEGQAWLVVACFWFKENKRPGITVLRELIQLQELLTLMVTSVRLLNDYNLIYRRNTTVLELWKDIKR